MAEMLIKYFALTDQSGNVYFNTRLYFLSYISIFEVKCISNSAELFVIGKDKLKVLLKEASTIRGNLESYIKTKKKMVQSKLLLVRESMISFIENFKMENSFNLGISHSDTSANEKKSPLSLKKRRLAIKESPILMSSFANNTKRSSDSSYVSHFNTINTNLPISLICLNPVSPIMNNQKKNNNFSHYISNTPFSTIGAYSTFQSNETKVGKKTSLANSLKLMSLGEIKRKLNLLNKKEVRWEILSKNSDQIQDCNYPQILPKQRLSKPKFNDKLILKEFIGSQEISPEIKVHQYNFNKELKSKPLQNQKVQVSFKDKKDSKSKIRSSL